MKDKEQETALPLLKGFLSKSHVPHRPDNRYIRVWCPFCGVFHTHGWGMNDDPSIAQHRSPHCNVQAGEAHPFPNGYWIAPFSESDVDRLVLPAGAKQRS